MSEGRVSYHVANPRMHLVLPSLSMNRLTHVKTLPSHNNCAVLKKSNHKVQNKY